MLVKTTIIASSKPWRDTFSLLFNLLRFSAGIDRLKSLLAISTPPYLKPTKIPLTWRGAAQIRIAPSQFRQSKRGCSDRRRNDTVER